VRGLRFSARGASFKTIETDDAEYPLARATSIKVTDLCRCEAKQQHHSTTSGLWESFSHFIDRGRQIFSIDSTTLLSSYLKRFNK
jgi:hypothetical protein